MRVLGWISIGVLIGLVAYHLFGVVGLAAIEDHLHPRFATAALQQAAADENRRTLDFVFGTVLALGGITLTCTVGYLSVPQERFSEAAHRLATQTFGGMYQSADDVSAQLARARQAIEEDLKSRPSLIAFYTLISIHTITPWTYRPLPKQRQALGNELRNAWRGARICVFVRGTDVWCVAWLSGMTAMAVLFASVFLTRLVSLDALSPGPWPLTTDLAQLGAAFTIVALVLVMAVAIMRALTALSVRRTIDEAREQEEGRLADEATRLIDQTVGV